MLRLPLQVSINAFKGVEFGSCFKDGHLKASSTDDSLGMKRTCHTRRTNNLVVLKVV